MNLNNKTVKELYLAKCTMNNESSRRTLGYKVGQSKNTDSRGLKAEFSKYYNTNKDIKVDTNVDVELKITLPEEYVDELEDFILQDYFKNEKLLINTKREYFESYEETYQKYDQLKKILEKYSSDIEGINSSFAEVKKDQPKILETIQKQYDSISFKIKEEGKKFVQPLSITKHTEKSKVPNNTNKTLRDVYEHLMQDFRLFKSDKTGIHYLQHKEYHKGKAPEDYRGAFSISPSNKKPSQLDFHLHNTTFFEDKYKQTRVKLNKCIEIFGDQIVKLDEEKKDANL